MDATQIFQFLRNYLETGLLLCLGYFSFFALVKIFHRLGLKPNYLSLVKTGYLLLVLSILIPILLLALPRSTLLRPAAQVWSGGNTSFVSLPSYVALSPVSPSSLDSLSANGMILTSKVLLAIVGMGVVCAVLLVSVFLIRAFSFHKQLRKLPVIRRIGKVCIRVSDHWPVAFSTWTPKTATVVVPLSVFEHSGDYRVTIAHEIQHHRHGDTRWLYFIEFLRASFFWNPGVYGFSRMLHQLQEFACDEFLIGRRKISPQAYGSCLIRAAESSLQLQSVLVGTASMAAMESSVLKRRIQMILNSNFKRPSKSVSFFSIVGLVVLMTSIAYAAKSSLQNKMMSLEEARNYADIAAKTSSIPISMNDLVLEKLNHYLGTPKGREWVKGSFARMPEYRQMILDKLNAHDLPEELIAISFFESGFKNLPPTPPQKGAGLWGFIAETAKRYKLNVAEQPGQVDDRLNPEKETEAAMQYLNDLNLQFKDWLLAIKAYNEGETQVQKLIDQNNTRDPWVLERKHSSEGYLSGVIAMIIILKNPALAN